MPNPPGDFQGRIEYLAESLLKGETTGGKDVGALSKSAGFRSYKIIKVSESGPHYDAEIKFMGVRKEKTVVVKFDSKALTILGIGPRSGGTNDDDDEDEPEETRIELDDPDTRPESAR